MKKVIISLLAVLCLCLTPFAAFADNKPTEWTDEERGITFTVPAGWTRVKEAEKDNIIYAFQKDGDENEQFLGYSSIDIYGNSDESVKSAYKRSDINNSIMTKEAFQQKMIGNASESGIENPVVDYATIGKYEYFKLNFTQKLNEKSNVNVVLYARIFNGYAYYFRFQTYKGAPNENDIITIISSVKFADEGNETTTKAPETTTQKAEESSASKKAGKSGLTGAAKGALIGCAAALIGVIVRFILKKKKA